MMKSFALLAAAGSNSTYDVLRVTTSATTVRAALTTAQTDRAEAESRLLALMADPTAYETVTFDDERDAPPGFAELAPAW